MNRQDLLAYAKENFKTIPDYPWLRFPEYVVLRHQGNKKWYGLVHERVRRSTGFKI
ncbi:hypothetical protein [Commensalibacter papalotli (ex Botero et al. 2024)]|uniref:MmcQ/YjbR family (MmcQ) (PDB:2A1V) (PUBMED:17266124) n=1 Tax=Commensalibacter papalotli (ex Botero et al. 2024) TaxID=2972766 RepID=A0ABM9HJN3_9PROT|nr:hypothetical protein [Commensalibacter papalotli (ex Botero et al. 2024)]CAI3924936.1 MmcQ/YjbR family (MmcQ) (PDB:2A1V) (PUBMED:17266124) [Commensalibacter papalotli (ex Botero et al. 2024)]CAI3927119.1 MmcQ/YjbR family (MmcQ) (PDB:2A1V) (PUBMED:17266124) [Commensalibacter papalotli (ex Botero et al. 2024)]